MNVSYLAGKLQDVMYSAPYTCNSNNNRPYNEQHKVDSKATISLNASIYREPMEQNSSRYFQFYYECIKYNYAVMKFLDCYIV